MTESFDPDSLNLRSACREDCELIFKWANDPAARSASFQSEKITWNSHREWFINKIESNSSYLFIATATNNLPVGIVRFDIEDGETFISVMIDNTLRGHGLGVKIIKMAAAKLLTESTTPCIRAKIKKENTASLKAFTKAGFKKNSDIVYLGIPTVCMTLTKTGNQ